MYKKTIFILLLFTILITSCRGKKEVSCPSFDPAVKENKKEKKGSKYKVVILKDGKKITGKKRRRKSKNRLFKKKTY
jgi:hypothetical protein